MKSYTAEEKKVIIEKVKELSKTKPMRETFKLVGISGPTYYTWLGRRGSRGGAKRPAAQKTPARMTVEVVRPEPRPSSLVVLMGLARDVNAALERLAMIRGAE